MTITAGNKADFELPGDLGEHDPRRMEHPVGNEPGAGGHEVKPNSKEVLGEGHNSEPTAAKHDPSSDPGRDNTAEHALEGGSTETMDRSKRQTAADHGGLREGDDEPFSRAGHQQQTNTEHVGHHNDHHHGHHHGSNQGQGYDGASSIRGPGQEGNFNREQEFSRQPNVTGDIHGHHQNEAGAFGSTGPGFSSRDQYQSGSEPISGYRGAGVAGEPYDAGNIQGSHSTRAGELLDPASGRETGIPGYAAGQHGHHGHHESGFTGSNTTGNTGLTGRDTTGNSGLTDRDTVGSNTTDSNTASKASKPSLMDRLNPMKDSDHDGKKGFMD